MKKQPPAPTAEESSAHAPPREWPLRVAVGVTVLFLILIVGGIGVVGGREWAQESAPSPAIDTPLLVSVPDFTGKPGSTNQSVYPLTITVPGFLVDKFAPHQSWEQTWLQPGAALCAGLLTVVGAVFALYGLSTQVRQQRESAQAGVTEARTSKRIENLWTQFTWVVDNSLAKPPSKEPVVNASAVTNLLFSIRSEAAKVDPHLNNVIQGYIETQQAKATALLSGTAEGKKALDDAMRQAENQVP